MRHVIRYPDRVADDEPRDLVWDDETGEVSGDHGDAEEVRRTLALGYVTEITTRRPLADPAHDPAEFLVALGHVPDGWRLMPGGPLHHLLPPSLRGVEPAPRPAWLGPIQCVIGPGDDPRLWGARDP